LVIRPRFSNGDIARELVVADPTVKTHVALIFAELDLHDRAQAVVLSRESARPARQPPQQPNTTNQAVPGLIGENRNLRPS
jgi:Bacterial regulatory proteins, luxR family